MVTAVYSGYTLYFASNRAFAHGDISYCLCQARDFVWGAQLGWDGVAILAPEHREKLNFLSRLARLRAKALDYFVYGELVEVLEPKNEIRMLSGTWNRPGGDGPISLSAVHAARWSAEDGSVAVVIANADTASHEFSFAWTGGEGNYGSHKRWSVERVTADAHEGLPDQEGNEFTYAVDVPGRDGVILIFQKKDGV